MKNIAMAKGAHTVVNTCVGAKAGEKILIVTEIEKFDIAKAVAAAVNAADAIPVLMIMPARTRDGEEPPEVVAEAMRVSDAFVCVVGKSITHTHAVKNACANGSRGIMMTQFSEEMMWKGGLTADFHSCARDCKAIAENLKDSEKIHLTTENGTDLTFSSKGRRSNAMYCIVDKGEFSPIPTVEANTTPVEGTANGRIIVDSSIPYIGIGVLDEPIEVTVKDGMITDIKGGRQAEMLIRDLEAKNDPNVYNIAELGVGLNPKCSFVGFMLEDEGVYGSAHIGIGTSITLGGNVKAACHYDLIMKDATIETDGKVILKNGKVMV